MMYRKPSDTITTVAPSKSKPGIDVIVENGKVTHLQLQHLELPHFTEPFLNGQDFQAAPHILARLPGHCSATCQLAIVQTLEEIMGVTLSEEVRLLRTLLNCAAWIENHAFHIYLRHAPKLLGYDNVPAMATNPGLQPMLERGLRLKRLGRKLLKVIGGEDNYLNWLAVGGFYQTPSRCSLLVFEEELKRGLEAALQTVEWTAGFTLPDFTFDGQCLALQHSTEYPMLDEGQIVATSNGAISPEEFAHYLRISNGVKGHNGNGHYAQAQTRTGYLTGPLARLMLNSENLALPARQALAASGLNVGNKNPFTSIVARSIELVHAIVQAQRLIENYKQPAPGRMPFSTQAGEVSYLSETPYGLLQHNYCVDKYGVIKKASIVPPTVLNLRQMKRDLHRYLPTLLDLPHQEIVRRCEQLVFCYEPGISKSLSVVDLTVKNGQQRSTATHQ